jgi:HEAT repeat protein
MPKPQPSRPTSRFRIAALVAGCVAVLLGGVVCYTRFSPIPAIAYRLVSGDTYTYSIAYTSTAQTDLGALMPHKDSRPSSLTSGPPAQPSTYAMQVSGTVEITVVEAREQDSLLAWSMPRCTVRISMRGKEIADQTQELRTALGRVCFVRVTADGAVRLLWLDESLGDLSAGCLRSLLATMQVSLPSGAATTPRRWLATENGPNGRFEVSYQVTPSVPRSARAVFTKRPLRHLAPKISLRSRRIKLSPHVKPTGEFTVCFSRLDGCVLSLEGAEQQALDIQGQPIGGSAAQLSLRLGARGRVRGAELAALKTQAQERLRRTRATTLAEAPSEQRLERSRCEADLKGVTPDDVLRELARQDPPEGNREQQAALYRRARAMLVLHPECCQKVADALCAGSWPAFGQQVALSALGAAGTQEAQTALVRALRAARGDTPRAMMALEALGWADLPTEEAVRAIGDLAGGPDRGIASAAQLALGTMAYHLAESFPERAEAICARVLAQLRGARSAEEREQLLLVLGNAGLRSTLPTLSAQLGDRSARIRGAAVWALRWVDDPVADQMLTRALTADPDDYVRWQAALALGYRDITPATFAAQRTALERDPSSQVRLAALGTLWNTRGSYPEVQRLAKTAEARDPDPGLRDAARSKVEQAQQGTVSP